MGRAQDDSGDELAHRPVGKDKSKIKNEFLAGVPDGGQVRVLALSDVLIHFNVDLFFFHRASSWKKPSLFLSKEEKNSIGKKNFQKGLYICFFCVIINSAFLRGLEKAPTFLVPIINPPFADNSPHFPSPSRGIFFRVFKNRSDGNILSLKNRMGQKRVLAGGSADRDQVIGAPSG
jgi:hypothetical protein